MFDSSNFGNNFISSPTNCSANGVIGTYLIYLMMPSTNLKFNNVVDFASFVVAFIRRMNQYHSIEKKKNSF
jgi:hypothetical protein